MPLTTLHDFNKSRMKDFDAQNKPKHNSIACPECQEELVDSNPMIVLLSYPKQTNVHCPSCGWKGTRIL